MREHSYEERLQSVLEKIAEDKFIQENHNIIYHINNVCGGDFTNLTNDLVELKYIQHNGSTRNGIHISGFSIKDKGTAFLKSGGFLAEIKRNKNRRIIRSIGLTLAISTFILTAIPVLKDCKGKEETSNKQTQKLEHTQCNHNYCWCHRLKKDTLKRR